MYSISTRWIELAQTGQSVYRHATQGRVTLGCIHKGYFLRYAAVPCTSRGDSAELGHEAGDCHAAEGVTRLRNGLPPGREQELAARADVLDLLRRELEREHVRSLALAVQRKERTVADVATTGNRCGVRQLVGLLEELADAAGQMRLAVLEHAEAAVDHHVVTVVGVRPPGGGARGVVVEQGLLTDVGLVLGHLVLFLSDGKVLPPLRLLTYSHVAGDHISIKTIYCQYTQRSRS